MRQESQVGSCVDRPAPISRFVSQSLGARAPQGQGSPVVVLHFHAWRSFPPRNCPRKKEPTSRGKVVKCQPRWDTMRSTTTMGTGRCTAKNQGRVHVSTPALQNPKGRFSTRTARATSHEEYIPTGFILHGSSDWVSKAIDSNTCSAGQGQFDPSVPLPAGYLDHSPPWVSRYSPPRTLLLRSVPPWPRQPLPPTEAARREARSARGFLPHSLVPAQPRSQSCPRYFAGRQNSPASLPTAP